MYDVSHISLIPTSFDSLICCCVIRNIENQYVEGGGLKGADAGELDGGEVEDGEIVGVGEVVGEERGQVTAAPESVGCGCNVDVYNCWIEKVCYN